MTPRLSSDQIQPSDAQVLPGALIKAMNEREGGDEAGLLLTRDTLQVLDEYEVSVQRLPADLAGCGRWLGYDHIEVPALTPQRMQALFGQLRQHAEAWQYLRAQCRSVTQGLRQQASSVEAQGARVVALADRVRALGAYRERWESLAQVPGVPLDAHDLQQVQAMGRQLMALRRVINDYDSQVDALRIGLEGFRAIAREQLIPAIAEKSQAAKYYIQSSEAHDLRWELDMLKEDIQAVRGEYRYYTKPPAFSWGPGAFGLFVSHSIYGPRAKAARDELRALEQRQRLLSLRLAQHVRVEGRVNALSSEIQRLQTELWDVVICTGYLHSAWQAVEAYLESSVERLQRMDTGQQLAGFMFHFRQFLSQWTAVGQHANSMIRVFD